MTQTPSSALARLAPALLLSFSLPALAATATRTEAAGESLWQALLFDGIKVGHAHSTRTVVAGEVRTTERMELEILRSSEPVRMASTTTYVETADGQPLGFDSEMTASAQHFRTRGVIRDGQIEVTQENAGASSTRTLPLPPGALLGEAQRLKLVASGFKPGTVVEFQMFEPSRLEAVRVSTRIVGPRRVEVYDRDLDLIEVEQTVFFPEQRIEARAFVDREFRPFRTSMQLLGMRIEIVTCDHRCATRPNQQLDYLGQLLIAAPRALTLDELRGGVRYVLATRDGSRLSLPQTSEQRMLDAPAAEVKLEVCQHCGSVGSSAEERTAALAATMWLQSDASEIVELTRAATKGVKAGDAQSRMQALTGFVRGHIRNKSLSVGYASALETARNRNGDCTEHALLLAAMGRAAGVPTRVATGFAYVQDFAGQRKVFVPHAWTQAWVDGRWRSYDAALTGFDAGHIVVATGDGDPSRFYAGMNVLGNLEVRKVEALGRERAP